MRVTYRNKILPSLPAGISNKNTFVACAVTHCLQLTSPLQELFLTCSPVLGHVTVSGEKKKKKLSQRKKHLT